MCDVIREYTDAVNILWIHKTIGALIELDEYPLQVPLGYTTDEEVLAIIHKHTHEPLQDTDIATRTNTINTIVNLDWERRLDHVIANIAEFREGRGAWEATRAVAQEQVRAKLATEMLRRIFTERGELWTRGITAQQNSNGGTKMYDKANVTWVHTTIDVLIELGEYPLLAPLRCTSNEEVLAIIRKHTSGLLENEDVAIRTNVINEITKLDRDRRYTESAEEIREVSLSRRRETMRRLQKELETKEEEAAIARGCHRCGGAIDTGSYLRTVQLIKPCSEGSMLEAYILCIECQGKIYNFLNGVITLE